MAGVRSLPTLLHMISGKSQSSDLLISSLTALSTRPHVHIYMIWLTVLALLCQSFCCHPELSGDIFSLTVHNTRRLEVATMDTLIDQNVFCMFGMCLSRMQLFCLCVYTKCTNGSGKVECASNKPYQKSKKCSNYGLYTFSSGVYGIPSRRNCCEICFSISIVKSEQNRKGKKNLKNRKRSRLTVTIGEE